MGTWADIVARITIAASLIVCTIPALFFLIISEAEARLVVGTLHSCIDEWCTFVRPWVPFGMSSQSFLAYTLEDTAKEMRAQMSNERLRLLAFQSTLLVFSLMMTAGVGVWYLYGTVTMSVIMSRIVFYIAIFCILELSFINTITRLPLLDKDAINLVLLDRIIDTGKACLP